MEKCYQTSAPFTPHSIKCFRDQLTGFVFAKIRGLVSKNEILRTFDVIYESSPMVDKIL